MAGRRLREWGRQWRTPGVTMIGLGLLYFCFPIGTDNTGALIIGSLVAGIGVVAVGWTFYAHIKRFVTGDDAVLTVMDLLVLFEVLLVVFSACYFVMATERPSEFAGLSTRLDAFYFSLTTFATVGFGDIHASGQVARALVSVQMLFDLVFVGALVSISTTSVKARIAAGEPIRPKPEEK